MKKIHSVTLIFLATVAGATPQNGYAIGNEAHGGAGMVCFNHGLTSIELLDLYEARAFFYLPIMTAPSPTPTDEPGKKAAVALLENNALTRLKDIDHLFGNAVEQQLAALNPIDIHSVAGQGLTLSPPVDIGIDLVDINCHPIGIGSYVDAIDTLFYDPIELNQISVVDQAAFWIHEAVYKVVRDIHKTRVLTQGSNWIEGLSMGLAFSGQDSRDVRQLISYLFAKESIATQDGFPVIAKAEFSYNLSYGDPRNISSICINQASELDQKMTTWKGMDPAISVAIKYGLFSSTIGLAPDNQSCNFKITDFFGLLRGQEQRQTLSLSRTDCLSKVEQKIGDPNVILVESVEFNEVVASGSKPQSTCTFSWISKSLSEGAQ